MERKIRKRSGPWWIPYDIDNYYTEYDKKNRNVLLVLDKIPIYKIGKREYDAIQNITNNQLHRLFWQSGIRTEKNHITKLDLQSLGYSKYDKHYNREFINPRIGDLHGDIGKLKYLEYLDINNCDITTIPESIESLARIKTINAYKNPLDEKFKSLLKRLKNKFKLTLKKEVNSYSKTFKY